MSDELVKANSKNISEALKKIRGKKTQTQVAKGMKIKTESTISRMESVDYADRITLGTLRRYAKACGREFVLGFETLGKIKKKETNKKVAKKSTKSKNKKK